MTINIRQLERYICMIGQVRYIQSIYHYLGRKYIFTLITEHVSNLQVTVHVRTIHTHTYLSVLFLLDLQ